MTKTVLVMGGSYFIGKKIVDLLLSQDYEIYILNRGSKKVTDKRIKNLISDRNDPSMMKEVLEEHTFDAVIDVSGVSPQQINILLNSLDTSSLKQFIFISSSAVYDINNQLAPFKETDKLHSNSYWTIYSQNKIDSEKVLREYFQHKDTVLSILRPPFVYGENNYAPRETFVFEHILHNKPIIVPGDGSTRLQFIYTTDLAMIISKLLTNPPVNLNIYNVGNRNSVTMIEWIHLCEKVVDKKATIVNFDYIKHKKNITSFFPFYDYDNVLDVNKVNEFYSEETDFIEGLKTTYEWYKDNIQSISFNDKVQQAEIEILDLLQIKNPV